MIHFFDTATLPTARMRDAMAAAELGDDVYGEDPTVNELEAVVAELLGMEAAVFLPSGSMANLVALLVHTRPGDEVIADGRTHVIAAEGGAIAAVAGVLPRVVSADHGTLRARDVRGALRPVDDHFPRTRLVWVENTHNTAGGRVTSEHVMRELREVCDAEGLRLHVDGARLWNAAVALGVPVRTLAAGADSIAVALSKGLGAPAGSLLAGTAAFVREARRRKKLLGGAMRQVGMLAAAGLVAVSDGSDRLEEDHRRARTLARRLNALPGVRVDEGAVETNIVVVDLEEAGMGAHEAVDDLRARGIKVAARPPHRLRFVTHIGIGDAEIDEAAAALTDLTGARTAEGRAAI